MQTSIDSFIRVYSPVGCASRTVRRVWTPGAAAEGAVVTLIAGVTDAPLHRVSFPVRIRDWWFDQGVAVEVGSHVTHTSAPAMARAGGKHSSGFGASANPGGARTGKTLTSSALVPLRAITETSFTVTNAYIRALRIGAVPLLVLNGKAQPGGSKGTEFVRACSAIVPRVAYTVTIPTRF